MYEYTPKNCESITINYSIISLGCPGTWDYPPEDPDIDIEYLEINGVRVPDDLESLLLGDHGNEWENEIIEAMPDAKAELEAERAEYLYDQMKDRELEGIYNGR
jgi:hypothetical protein